MDKIKLTKQIEIKKDLLDMQIEKVRLKTEMEVLDKAIKDVTAKYNKELEQK